MLFVGLFFLVGGITGGRGGDPCDDGLVRLGSTEPNAETFAATIQGVSRVIDALESGDRDGARANFYGPTHNFSHNVEPPLREVDSEAAKDLCESVLDIEETIERGSFAEAAADARKLRAELEQAAEVLGYT